jgi:hypothetical protein
MSEIIYPTLDLFLYDLHDGLGENAGEIADNKDRFLQKLPDRIRSAIEQRDAAVEAEYVELLGNRGREQFNSSSQKYTLKGYYYPVRLGDSYGLLLDCSVEHSLGHPDRSQTEVFPVSCFADLKTELDRRLADSKSTIGQVWMVSGEIPNFTPDKAESVAQACCQIPELEIDWERDFLGKSQFAGGILFEFWRYRFNSPDRSSNSELNPICNIHQLQDNYLVLIALYPNSEIARKASALNFDWLRLFAYRSKILWAYGQSQYLRQKLKYRFVLIQQYLKEFDRSNTRNLNLKQLRKTLVDAQNTLANYSIDLNYLNTQKRTIEVNLLNYGRRLKRMNQCLKEFQAVSDLEFLNKFSDNVESRYLVQIQSDYESFSVGVTLLGELINSIRGVTEIDQSERDRNFQNTVAILGVGLAAGSIVASIATQFPGASDHKEAAKYPLGSTLSQLGIPDPWLVPAISATASIGIAVLAALITALVIKLSWFFKKYWLLFSFILPRK